jgi:site-specific DNA-methyltransferase (adenine-specific)
VAAPAVITPGDEIDLNRLLEAFRQVRQGMSADYVVADPKTNARFQEAARALGLRADPARINQALLNARKAGRLKDEPSASQYRLAREYEPYVFASEWSVRHLQRQLLKEINRMPSLDELLANPAWAGRFDEIAVRIKPGFEPIDYRWAALAMRKKGRNKPLEKAVEMPLQRQLTLDGLFGSDLPADPGLYLIQCGERSLYLNWAESLAKQMERHREVAGEELVCPWLLEGVGRADQLRYTALRGLRERELQEMRITQVARLEPWLNMLDIGEAA